jgi:predicted MFS family arabinose efflux permease
MRRILEAYRQSFTGLPQEAWLLAAASLINRSGTMVLPFLTLYLTSQRGFQTDEAGWVSGVYGIGSVAGSWLGGLLTDRVGARRVQVLSLVANGIGFFALGLAESRPAIFVTALAVSTVSEAFRPANAAALADASPPHLTSRTFALNRMAVNMGMTVGMVFGGFLAVHGYGWLFGVDGVTCLISALVLARSPDVRAARPHPREKTGVSPYRDRMFLAAWGFIVLLALVFFQLHATFTLYLRDAYGLREDAIGGLLAVNTVLVVLLEVLIVHRLEKREPLGIVTAGAFFVCLGFALLPYGRSPAWVAFTIVVWTAGEIASFAFLSTFVASRTAPGMQGRYMGMYVMAFAVAYVLAPPLGTWVYRHLGGDWVWHGCGVLGAVLVTGFGLMALARRRAARVEPAAPRSLAGDAHDQ